MATEVPTRPIAQLPQKPASKPAWLNGEGEPVGEVLKIPEDRPDLVVFIKTQAGYVKAMQMNKEGDSLFGTGEVAHEFTEIVSEAISKKIHITCVPPEDSARSSAAAKETSRIVLAYIEKQKEFEVAVTKLVITSFAAVVIGIIAFLIINKMRGRGR